MTETTLNQRRRRRSVRVSLRVFTLLILVVGGGMGWEAHRARTMRSAVAVIKRAGYVTYKDRFTGGNVWAPNWLSSRCGLEHFADVQAVDFFGINPLPKEMFPSFQTLGELEKLNLFWNEITDDDLVRLVESARFRQLSLFAGGGVTDLGLFHLASCKSIETLTVWIRTPNLFAREGSAVSDAWLAELAELPRLRKLTLHGFSIGHDGLAQLGKLDALRELDLSSTTDATGRTLVTLEQFPRLTRLKLDIVDANTVDISGLQQLRFALELEVRLFDRSGAESPLVVNIGRIQRLESLTLSASHEDGWLPPEIWKRLEELPNLRELNVHSGKLTETDCEGISRLRRLEKLGFKFSTSFATGGAKHIGKMAGLKELSTLRGPSAVEMAEIQQALPSLKITR